MKHIREERRSAITTYIHGDKHCGGDLDTRFANLALTFFPKRRAAYVPTLWPRNLWKHLLKREKETEIAVPEYFVAVVLEIIFLRDIFFRLNNVKIYIRFKCIATRTGIVVSHFYFKTKIMAPLRFHFTSRCNRPGTYHSLFPFRNTNSGIVPSGCRDKFYCVSGRVYKIVHK